MESGPGPRVFVGVDRSLPGLAALRFAVDEARRRGAPLYAVRVSENLTVHQAQEIDTAFAESLGGYPADVVVHRELLIGPVAETLTRRARFETDVLIVGTHGGGRRRVFGVGSISRACVRKARCPVLVVPGPEIAATVSAWPGARMWQLFRGGLLTSTTASWVRRQRRPDRLTARPWSWSPAD